MLRDLLRVSKSETRLASRLEAFSDLVFGFSLSLLATRLDVPARAQDVFQASRWFPIIVTFALICRFWLEHYRIFRHNFAVRSFDMVINFIFLFAIAVLPYAVQTFLRFQVLLQPFSLYLSDLCLVLATLSILRVRGLRQRRENTNDETRLSDWRRSLMQFAIVAVCFTFLLLLQRPGANLRADMRAFGLYGLPVIVVLSIIARQIRQLPTFLRPVQEVQTTTSSQD
jgi:uncharacterized membrane protein